MPRPYKVTNFRRGNVSFGAMRAAQVLGRSRKIASVRSQGGAGFARGARPGYAQVAAVVRGMGIRGETKSVDIPRAVATLAVTIGNANSQSFTLIQEGAGFWNRIGRKAALKSLYLTGMLELTGAVGALVQETVRYIIFYDKQPNGVAATWNQVVQAYDNAGGVTNYVWDGINLDNRDRFVILRDRKIALPGTTATGIANTLPYGASEASIGATGSDGGSLVKEYIKLNNLEAQFNGTANPATVAQISTGNVGIVVQGSVGGQYTFGWSARMRFTDC